VFVSARTVVRWDERKRAALARRWQARALAAAKQSRNPFVMDVGAPVSWRQLCAALVEEPLALVLWEQATRPLREALTDARRVALVVGPEGGLGAAEADELQALGAHPVSLGPRILRTENAAVVATSAILFERGLIG
jgi:16S rRNA (uracil1498-N3)-methyltransferase